MKRQTALSLLAFCCLSTTTALAQGLSLGTAEGQFGATITVPLTLSTSPLGEPVQAAQAIFDWADDAGTGVGLDIDPRIEADADFLNFHVATDWMALGFTIVTAPLLGDDIPLADAVIRCGPGPAASVTPVAFRDRVYSVPGSSLVLSNPVTIDSSSVRKENGLVLNDGSLRCFGAEICGDAIDNDGDGLSDAQDPDCPADIQVTPLALDYGSVLVGTDSSRDLTIRNAGSKKLTISAITVLSNPDFAIARGPATPAALDPGEAVIVTVTYAPREDELDSGVLRVISDDADEPAVSVPLAGSGLATLSGGLGAHLPLDCSAEDLVSGETGAVVAFVGCASDRFDEDGKAMAFGGNGRVDGNSFPIVVGDFILEAWFRPDPDAPTGTGTVFVIHNQDDPAQIPALGLEWDGQAGLLLLRRGDSPIAVEGLAADWHHVLIARELGALSLYIDGQLKSSRADSAPLGGAYTLGADPNGSRLYHGRLDELILEVSPLDGEMEVISRALRGGPSAYVHPSARVRDVTANPGFAVKALDQRFTTASSEGGDLELASLALVARDITAAGGASPGLDYLSGGRLALQAECGAPGSEVTVGEFVATQVGIEATVYALTSAEPVLLPPASESCFVALFDLDMDAPLGRVIQFHVATLEDIEIAGAPGEGRYLVGERLVDQAALAGDRLKILDLPPPELELVFPADMETINAADSLADAAMHTLVLGAGDSEGLRLLDIAYRAVEGTSLDGLTNPRLFVDLNGNGVLDAGEDPRAGAVDAGASRIVFTSLGIEIPPSSEIELVLLADLELSESATAGGALAVFLMLAAGALLLRTRHGRLQPGLASALALVLVCCVISIGAGCGGGGGGGGKAPATVQQSFHLTIGSADDIRAEGLTSGTEPDLGAFPAGGIPGPLYVLKG